MRASGARVGEAYVAVYGGDKRRASSRASRLDKRPDVAGRIAELQEQSAERMVSDVARNRDWIIANLRENVERSLQAKPVLNRQGKPTGEWRYDGTVANRSLELLGNELGMFVKRSETRVGTVGEELLNKTPEEIEERMNLMAENIGYRFVRLGEWQEFAAWKERRAAERREAEQEQSGEGESPEERPAEGTEQLH
jgi:hypothetical protein